MVSDRNRCILDLDRCSVPFGVGTKACRPTACSSDSPSNTRNVEIAVSSTRLMIESSSSESVIMALVTSSGPLGLSAFFPTKGTSFTTATLAHGKPYPKYLPPPHLPLSPTWHEADFSLESVMSTTALPDETVDLREYCMKLLSRYLYLSGASHIHDEGDD